MKKLVEVTLKQGVSKVCRRKLPQISKRFYCVFLIKRKVTPYGRDFGYLIKGKVTPYGRDFGLFYKRKVTPYGRDFGYIRQF